MSQKCVDWLSVLFLTGFGIQIGCAQDEPRRAESPVHRIVQLRAPGFDDVSRFGESETAQIDAWLRKQLATAGYPALSVAVTQDGKLVYQAAIGFENVEKRTKTRAETSFHAASVTKVFTTTLAAVLHERGIVDLDQRAIDHLPDGVSISATPDKGAQITLRQLASHTSGLPRRVPGPVQSVEGRYQLEPQHLYAYLAKLELVFEPGTDERYSNLGMGLLGHVLERAAGKPFHRLLQEEILRPLKLDHTTVRVDDHTRLRLATGYSGGHPYSHKYVKRFVASGGIVTSAPDLATFLSAQMKSRTFSQDVLTELHTPTKLADGAEARTGLGWAVRRRKALGRILKKNGGRANCSAWIGFAPDHGVGVAVVTNCGEPSVDEIGLWLLERSAKGVDPSLLDRRPVVTRKFAKVAPFSGVRWKDDRPIIRVRDRWRRLVSIDGFTIDRIMVFAQRRYGELARKRFSEDIVEVLSDMGHDPKWEVTLIVEDKDNRTETLREAMTIENRNRVRNARRR